MSTFLSRLKSNQASAGANAPLSPTKSKPGDFAGASPFDHALGDSRVARSDGADKMYGMHNPSNTCYANSVLQCLFFSNQFRQNVINFPRTQDNAAAKTSPLLRAKINADAENGEPTTAGMSAPASALRVPPDAKPSALPRSLSGGSAARAVPAGDSKESFDERKKQLMAAGPHIRSDRSQHARYGMDESLFTSLKDLFEAIIAHSASAGVVVPTKFMDNLRQKHADYRGAAHQDAHEFLNLLLNEVVEEVEGFAKRTTAPNSATLHATAPVTNGLEERTSWIRDIFEGVLTSETRCLTCENVSQRDEIFLDLSVDLEEHSSVSSSLQKFSQEEMLREKNKFHCDTCCGLQEAEKRLKIKKLPRTLALHLKRFKYVEEIGNMQKLFHKVVFPFFLRLLNTTEDTQDPDRLYELYAVIVHLGTTPFHGHYVSIIKTKSRGWVLFDDELVIPVDANYVRNFFGGQRSPACAYVLFYQEAMEEVGLRENNSDQDAVTALAQKSEVVDNAVLSPTTPAADDYMFSFDQKSPVMRPSSAEDRDLIAKLENPAGPPSNAIPISGPGRLGAKKSGELNHSFELPASVTSVFKSKDSKKSSELSESVRATESSSASVSQQDVVPRSDDAAHSPEKPSVGRQNSKRSNGLHRLRTTSFSTRTKALFGSSKSDTKEPQAAQVQEPPTQEGSPEKPERKRPGSSANAAERIPERVHEEPEERGPPHEVIASPTRLVKHDTQKSSFSKLWHRSDKVDKDKGNQSSVAKEKGHDNEADTAPDEVMNHVARADSKMVKQKGSRFGLGRKKSGNNLLL